MMHATDRVTCPFCHFTISASLLMIAGSSHRVGACVPPVPDNRSVVESFDCPAAELEDFDGIA